MMMAHSSPENPFISALEESEGADDDPGPSPVALLIAHSEWRGLGDVERLIERAHAATAAKVDAISSREVVVLLTSDAEVAALNAQYRGLDKPTNVLSFPSAAIPAGIALALEDQPLGDIAIAYETVMAEAGQEDKPPLFHLAHLTVHGLLHLAGFDHDDEAEAERMESLERDILASMDIPDPYHNTSEELPVMAG
jgi:probable rRNA maturation factor